jgi:hypothetical protein
MKRDRAARSTAGHLPTAICVAEAYRTLRTNIEFASVDAPIRTLLVTSAVAGEGKTITAANLAVVFAQAGAGSPGGRDPEAAVHLSRSANTHGHDTAAQRRVSLDASPADRAGQTIVLTTARCLNPRAAHAADAGGIERLRRRPAHRQPPLHSRLGHPELVRTRAPRHRRAAAVERGPTRCDALAKAGATSSGQFQPILTGLPDHAHTTVTTT